MITKAVPNNKAYFTQQVAIISLTNPWNWSHHTHRWELAVIKDLKLPLKTVLPPGKKYSCYIISQRKIIMDNNQNRQKIQKIPKLSSQPLHKIS